MFVWTFWFSIPEKHIYSLKEDTSLSERTSDMYLVTDSFGGNFNCDVAGPLRYLYLLELKEATLYVSRDGQQLYSKITFFKACKQLQFTVTFDIPCAPPPPLYPKETLSKMDFSPWKRFSALLQNIMFMKSEFGDHCMMWNEIIWFTLSMFHLCLVNIIYIKIM